MGMALMRGISSNALLIHNDPSPSRSHINTRWTQSEKNGCQQSICCTCAKPLPGCSSRARIMNKKGYKNRQIIFRQEPAILPRVGQDIRITFIHWSAVLAKMFMTEVNNQPSEGISVRLLYLFVLCIHEY